MLAFGSYFLRSWLHSEGARETGSIRALAVKEENEDLYHGRQPISGVPTTSLSHPASCLAIK